MPATLEINGGTAQQRAWVNEAMARSQVDWLTAIPSEWTVRFVWADEPPLPGHQESACTIAFPDTSLAIITIRSNLDNPEAWPEGKPFYVETVVHELGHVLCFTMTTEADREAMCPWFSYDGGDGDMRQGTAADLNPTDRPWADRIQECMAEIVKDALLPEQYRAADNRTNWRIDKSRFTDFFAALIPGDPGSPGDPGVGGFSTSGDAFFHDPTVVTDGTFLTVEETNALGEAFGRPEFGATIIDTYTFTFDFELPPEATNVQLEFRMRGGAGASFHLVSEGHADDPDDPDDFFVPAVYEWPPPDLVLNDTVMGTFPLVGNLTLRDPRNTYLDQRPDGGGYFWIFADDIADMPAPGEYDFSLYSWKPGIDPPYDWTQYSLSIFADFRPHIHYSYDVPGEGATDPVPPTPAVTPPWPYEDPELRGGGSDVAIFRL